MASGQPRRIVSILCSLPGSRRELPAVTGQHASHGPRELRLRQRIYATSYARAASGSKGGRTQAESRTIQFQGGRLQKQARQEAPGSTISTRALSHVSSVLRLRAESQSQPHGTQCVLNCFPPGETESGSAGTQPDKGDPGRRCADGASGLWRLNSVRGLRFLSPSDTGAMPPKIPGSGAEPLGCRPDSRP